MRDKFLVQQEELQAKAFIYFVKEWRDLGTRKLSWQNYLDLATPIWQNMTLLDRRPYLDKVQELHLMEFELVSNQFDMRDQIEKLVQNSIDRDELETQNFYFLKIQHVGKDNKALQELVVDQFSLQEGVQSIFYALIDPEVSQEPARAAIIRQDLKEIYTALLEFVHPAPVFTLQNEIPEVYKSLKSLNGGLATELSVYSIEYLFYILKATCQTGTLPPTESFESYSFQLDLNQQDILSNISCELHEPQEILNLCAKTPVKLWELKFAEMQSDKDLENPVDATKEPTIKVEPTTNDFFSDPEILEALNSLDLDFLVGGFKDENAIELGKDEITRDCDNHMKDLDEDSSNKEDEIPPPPPVPLISLSEEGQESCVIVAKSSLTNPDMANYSNCVEVILQNTKTCVRGKSIDSNQVTEENNGWYSPPPSPELSRSVSRERGFGKPCRSRSKNQNSRPIRRRAASNRRRNERWRSASNSRNISPRFRGPWRSRSKSPYISPSRKSISRNGHSRERWHSGSNTGNISPRSRRPWRSRSKSRNVSPSRKRTPRYGHSKERWSSRSNSRSSSPSLRRPWSSRLKSQNISPSRISVSGNRHFKRNSSSRGSASGNTQLNDRWRSNNRNISPIRGKSLRSRSNSRSISPNRYSRSASKDRHFKKHWRSRSKRRNSSQTRRKPYRARSNSLNVSPNRMKSCRSRSKSRNMSPGQKVRRKPSRLDHYPLQSPCRGNTDLLPREKSRRGSPFQYFGYIPERSLNVYGNHESAQYNYDSRHFSQNRQVKARELFDNTDPYHFFGYSKTIETISTSRTATIPSLMDLNLDPMLNPVYQSVNHYEQCGYQSLNPYDLRYRLQIRRQFSFDRPLGNMYYHAQE